MTRTFPLLLALALAVVPLGRAVADDARDKASNLTAEPVTKPKIRVILPALWEPATPQAASQEAAPQAASSQRSVVR
jgi:hypothetical protein